MKKLFLFSLLFANTALAADCGDRLQGYNIYERKEKGQIVEKVSIGEINHWSQHSAFQGILVAASEKPKTKVEIEILKTKKAKNTEQKRVLDLGNWDFKNPKQRDFREAQNFKPEEFLSEKEQGKFFQVKLVLEGKELCRQGPFEIREED